MDDHHGIKNTGGEKRQHPSFSPPDLHEFLGGLFLRVARWNPLELELKVGREERRIELWCDEIL